MSFEIAMGLATGYGYSLAKTKEDEVKQGKNYYQASACQAVQVGQLSNLSGRYIQLIPNPVIRLTATAINATTPLTSFLVCPTLAAIKQDHYEQGVETLKKINLPLTRWVPHHLSPSAKKTLGYVSEHFGDFLRYGMVAGTLALPFIGNPFFSGAMLVPVLYEAIDSRKYVPRKISRVVERYMPTVSDAFMIIGGGLALKVFSAANLASQSSSISKAVHHRIDRFARMHMAIPGPSLEEVDAPLIMRKDLHYKTLLSILEANPEEFEINPAHGSKSCVAFAHLEESFQFQDYLVLFDSIDWESKSSRIQRLLNDDDRFIDLVKTEGSLEQLLLKREQSLKVFFPSYLREQFVQFVKYISGEDRPKGYQQDLDDAIANCAKILPHLKSLKIEIRHEQIELEDALLKLAIEGGDYCARGIRRASQEMVQGIIRGVSFDLEEDYEKALFQTLETLRLTIMQDAYIQLIRAVTQLTNQKATAIAEDVHTLDIFRKILSLGFYPLTHNERRSFGLGDLYNWNLYSSFREMMYVSYLTQLDSAIHELGELSFSLHMRQLLMGNPHLSFVQKEEILDRFMGDPEVVLPAFHRLMLFMLGVIRKKRIEEENWELLEVTEEEPAQDDWTLI